ncbi:MAG: nucleotidyltransferase domain-containing protein [Thermoprotei archaeon]|nr:MAG: nucleotidyltransferase domain-containing protein [Thermoprotei archaeon]
MKAVPGELRKLREKLGGEIYLFGSYAKGTHTLESDVDIVVVSERFEGLKRPERVEAVRSMLPEDLGLDIIALTPKEFEEKLGRASYKDISRHWVKVE